MFKLTSQQPKYTRFAYVHQQLMLSKMNNKVIAIDYFKHEGYHNVKGISKSSGTEITEARGDEDVFPSSSLTRGVRLVGEV